MSFAPSDDAPGLVAADVVPERWTTTRPVPRPMLVGAAAGGRVLVTAVMLLFRRARRRRRHNGNQITVAFPTPIAELERALDVGPRAELDTPPEPLGLPPGRSIQDRVTDVVRADVARAAGVLTGWLSQVQPTPTPAKGTK